MAVRDEAHAPLVQAALVHAQFETIHPFDDGNGRTGRALVHTVLRRRGLAAAYVPPISVVLAAERSAYIAGLTAFREGGRERWIEFFAVTAAAWAVLDLLPAHPVITAPVAAATGRARSAVHQAVGQFEGAGILLPPSEGRRNRVWEAHGLLDLIARVESGRMEEA